MIRPLSITGSILPMIEAQPLQTIHQQNEASFFAQLRLVLATSCKIIVINIFPIALASISSPALRQTILEISPTEACLLKSQQIHIMESCINQ